MANKFTLSTQHLFDERLSLKAKGLLTMMLSQPPDWDYTIQGLTEQLPDGRDAVRAAMNELIASGYVQRIRMKDEHGRYTGNHYIIDPGAGKGRC